MILCCHIDTTHERNRFSPAPRYCEKGNRTVTLGIMARVRPRITRMARMGKGNFGFSQEAAEGTQETRNPNLIGRNSKSEYRNPKQIRMFKKGEIRNDNPV